jgi:hypothetical protein
MRAGGTTYLVVKQSARHQGMALFAATYAPAAIWLVLPVAMQSPKTSKEWPNSRQYIAAFLPESVTLLLILSFPNNFPP